MVKVPSDLMAVDAGENRGMTGGTTAATDVYTGDIMCCIAAALPAVKQDGFLKDSTKALS
jgi:hypothetical protein